MSARAPNARARAYRNAKERVERKKEAAKKLEEVEEETKQDAEQEKRKERAVLGGDLDWKMFLKPGDVTDLEECRRVDEFNQGVYEHNNSMLPKINELLIKLGMQKMRLDPPPRWYPVALRKWEEAIWAPEFRILEGQKFLWEQREKLPFRDYVLEEAPKLADDLAEELAIQAQIRDNPAGVDITDAAGRKHASICTCECLWDGQSERCLGQGVRVRWKREKDHHFLKPSVVPECY